ncbi:MAG: hypothetical protein A3E85_03445 [Gammaproteobacteria bacterium RIFCSPHIGHO2_12_FULL_45_12]|nr:MAG: hypothetical protein A3E85_03445 [Gammaproteobacteria bacterium RIFCSPHIGHO2_12_FULL_45_12]
MTVTEPLDTPFSAIVFDCDGTLSTIEGIDELAKHNHTDDTVQALTQTAMGHAGLTVDIYEKRLNLVRPTKAQVESLGQHYLTHQIPDAKKVIHLFQQLQKTVYIISAGLYPAVTLFADHLAVPRANVFAVDIHFDAHGHYLDFDHDTPLTGGQGKRAMVTQLMAKHHQVLYVGDGLNDYAVHDIVTRFVGFGGAFYRENIASLCSFYLKTRSMAALLPLALTPQEIENLSPEQTALFKAGLRVTA